MFPTKVSGKGIFTVGVRSFNIKMQHPTKTVTNRVVSLHVMSLFYSLTAVDEAPEELRERKRGRNTVTSGRSPSPRLTEH